MLRERQHQGVGHEPDRDGYPASDRQPRPQRPDRPGRQDHRYAGQGRVGRDVPGVGDEQGANREGEQPQS